MTRVASLLLALVLLAFGLAACGDNSDDGDASSKDDPMSAAEPGNDESDDSDDSDSTDEDEPAAEPDTPPVFVDGPGDVTLTFAGGEDELGAGEFDQSEITISVGQTVEFVAGDGGTYGVKVGGLDGVTISGGLKEYYRFDAAGTYSVEEDISGATASIIVQ